MQKDSQNNKKEGITVNITHNHCFCISIMKGTQ